MVIVQNRPLRKPTGGRYGKLYRMKRKYEIGRAPALTGLAEQKIETIRTKGGGKKTKVFASNKANVLDPKTKTCKVVMIKTVSLNPANQHYQRRNIMTKGAIIETELGKARITSRPGQSGTVNAVLV